MTSTDDDSIDDASRSLIHIPETPDDFRPPKPSSMVAEMASLQRHPEHWAEVAPYLKAIAGQIASIEGSARYDEAGCMFKIKEICHSNGYTLLAKANVAKLAQLFKYAYKRNTGQTMKMLQKQGSQLRLEFKRAQKPTE
jgi:hypothetical protein